MGCRSSKHSSKSPKPIPVMFRVENDEEKTDTKKEKNAKDETDIEDNARDQSASKTEHVYYALLPSKNTKNPTTYNRERVYTLKSKRNKTISESSHLSDESKERKGEKTSSEESEISSRRHRKGKRSGKVGESKGKKRRRRKWRAKIPSKAYILKTKREKKSQPATAHPDLNIPKGAIEGERIYILKPDQRRDGLLLPIPDTDSNEGKLGKTIKADEGKIFNSSVSSDSTDVFFEKQSHRPIAFNADSTSTNSAIVIFKR